MFTPLKLENTTNWGFCPLSHAHGPPAKETAQIFSNIARRRTMESLEERVRLYGKSLGLKVRETWIFILALSFTNLWLWANYITSLTLTFLICKMGRMSVSQGYFGGLLFGLVITSLSMVIAS